MHLYWREFTTRELYQENALLLHIEVHSALFGEAHILPTIEFGMIERTRDMNVYLELHSLKDLSLITNHLKAQDAQILEIDIDRAPQNHRTSFGVVISVLLPRRMPHTQVIATLMQLKCIRTINEI